MAEAEQKKTAERQHEIRTIAWAADDARAAACRRAHDGQAEQIDELRDEIDRLRAYVYDLEARVSEVEYR